MGCGDVTRDLVTERQEQSCYLEEVFGKYIEADVRFCK